MKYSSHKELNKRIRELVRAGSIYWRGGKHGRLRLPSGKILTISITPSSQNAAKNFDGQVKRATQR